MPSIWYQCICAPHEPRRLHRGLLLSQALDMLPEAVESWANDSPGRTYRPRSGSCMEYALFQLGRFHGSLWVEACSPPTAAERWDRRRAKAAKS